MDDDKQQVALMDETKFTDPWATQEHNPTECITPPPYSTPYTDTGTKPPEDEPQQMTITVPPQQIPFPPAYATSPPHAMYGQPLMVYNSGQHAVMMQPLMGQPATVGESMQEFRKQPVNTVCPSCGSHILTGTKASPGMFTYLLCLLLCLFGLNVGCCLIPFCVPGCQDIIHYCPQCRVTINVYKRM